MDRRSLDTYRRKRDPARTPEPFGAPVPASGGAPTRRFVVQQHDARRMHWDLRLEIEGVLASWAVPRGPSIDPQEKRLAVQTEDHPLEYADFEGIIPPGNYGAGAMIVWDTGTYRTVDDADPATGVRDGKLDLLLTGHKLRGRWALVRTKGSEGKEWLLFKKPDGLGGSSEPVVAQPGSVLSGLTVTELRDGVARTGELAAEAKAAGAPQRALPPGALAPMLAETATQPFSRPGWVFELKYDGIRLLIVREPGTPPRLMARSGRDVTASFPEIAAAAAHLSCDAFVIDGELIAIDDRGTGSFERLQQRLGLTNPWTVSRARAEVPIQVFGFDLLAAGGYDLRGLALLTRKAMLRRLLPSAGVIRFADHIEEHGAAFFDAACQHGVEGMVGKRADAPYASGRRSRDWVKVKAPRTVRLAVVGYLPGRNAPDTIGSLMLAWREGDRFVHAGNAGSGLTEKTIAAVLARHREAPRPTPAFLATDVLPRTAVFVEPCLVVEVRFTEITVRGVLRQPVFLRICEDVGLEACAARMDFVGRPAIAGPTEPDPEEPTAPPESNASAAADEPAAASPGRRLALSNLGKIFWPADGYTKGDLLTYYERIWPAIAPYLRDRPVVLTRYPDGIDGKSFFQKNAPDFIPDWVSTCRIDDTEYFLCNELDALLYVINMGCIPLHVGSARRQTIERPDWAILDLDPKEAPFRHVLAVARCIHQLLEPLDVPHFIKTSGQAGLHVLIPLGGTLTHVEATRFAEVLARLVVGELPEIATVARPLNGRGGKVYVDFLQNGAGKTIAAPFCVRPRGGAPVSTPLVWSEVNARLDQSRFTIATVPRRLEKRPDPMRAVLETSIDVTDVLTALASRVRD